jgi:anti-sigma B factor antagonist
MSTLLKRSEGDVLIAYFQDVRIIDETRISSLGQELGEMTTKPANNKIVLNFQNVSFMSSAMIGKLVLFDKKCKAAKIELRMCGINDNVEEVFSLMKLGKVFKIDKDEETAIKNFSKKGWFG